MKNLSLFQRILIWIMTIIFVLTIIFSVLKVAVVDKINHDVFNMVTAIRYTFFEEPIKSTNKWINDTLTLQEIRQENDKLKENISSVERYQTEINELRVQNNELKELLGFKDANTGLNLKAAKVIFRDFDRWNNVIKINLGKVDNVKVNDAVVVANGIIGRIETVDETSSTVRLLISNDRVSKVAIKIMTEDDKFVEGIIDSYDSDTKKFKLSLLETSDNIKKDQYVSTSGSGGTIPSGILVGYISSVEASASELAESILVTPSADFESFETVFVVAGDLNE